MKKVRPRPLCPARLPDPGEAGFLSSAACAAETLAREMEREEGVLRVERDILNEPHGSGPRRCER